MNKNLIQVGKKDMHDSEERRDQAAYMAQINLIEPLMEWKFISVEKIGSRHTVSLTDENNKVLIFPLAVLLMLTTGISEHDANSQEGKEKGQSEQKIPDVNVAIGNETAIEVPLAGRRRRGRKIDVETSDMILEELHQQEYWVIKKNMMGDIKDPYRVETDDEIR